MFGIVIYTNDTYNSIQSLCSIHAASIKPLHLLSRAHNTLHSRSCTHAAAAAAPGKRGAKPAEGTMRWNHSEGQH